MDKSLRQTLGAFDLVHSSHKWVRQYCSVWNTAQQCRLGLFQDSDFAGYLEGSTSTSRGVLCIFESHTFVPTSWMCKKRTSVSHSSTEAKIISIDAGLCIDGIPALTLWDSVIEVFHSVPNKIEQPKEELRRNPLQATKPNLHNPIQCKQAHKRHSNWHWPHSIQHNAFWCFGHVVCLWGQPGGNQNEYQR